MRARLFCALLALLMLAQGSALADARYQVARDTMVRLQVRAASDAHEDQAVKLLVRDAVRERAASLVLGARDQREALSLLKASARQIQISAVAAARAAGYDGPVSVEVGEVRFPTKLYGQTLVPPGIYRALRVTLGSGCGRNWWCVVYPDLCATDPLARQALRDGEGIEFYSSVLRWLNREDETK